MNYYIDFDNTIFDTVSFHNDLIKILIDNNIPESYINEYYKKNGVAPLALVNSLCNEVITEKVDKLFKNAKKYLYKDAIDFLKTKSFNKPPKNESLIKVLPMSKILPAASLPL